MTKMLILDMLTRQSFFSRPKFEAFTLLVMKIHFSSSKSAKDS
jgi:hypothetical protein